MNQVHTVHLYKKIKDNTPVYGMIVTSNGSFKKFEARSSHLLEEGIGQIRESYPGDFVLKRGLPHDIARYNLGGDQYFAIAKKGSESIEKLLQNPDTQTNVIGINRK